MISVRNPLGRACVGELSVNHHSPMCDFDFVSPVLWECYTRGGEGGGSDVGDIASIMKELSVHEFIILYFPLFFPQRNFPRLLKNIWFFAYSFDSFPSPHMNVLGPIPQPLGRKNNLLVVNSSRGRYPAGEFPSRWYVEWDIFFSDRTMRPREDPP